MSDTPAVFRKTLTGLVPVDDPGRELLAKAKIGDLLMVTVKKPRSARSLQWHRRLFALLKIVFDNQEHYATQDALLDVIKIAVGHTDVVQTLYRPRSISFASMSHEQFGEFWNAVVHLVCERILPGVSEAQLENEISELVGVAPMMKERAA